VIQTKSQAHTQIWNLSYLDTTLTSFQKEWKPAGCGVASMPALYEPGDPTKLVTLKNSKANSGTSKEI
jgi:hypothetical protein